MRGVAGEIGGFIEFERYGGEELHRDALALNCGRSCLAYVVEARGISSIWVPSFLCDSVTGVLARYPSVAVHEYPVTRELLPDYERISLGPNDYLYLVDYCGQLTEGDVRYASSLCDDRLVVDEAQGFFVPPVPGVDTLYTCRKFFGVPDGAYLYTTARLGRELPPDESHNRMGFLLGRFERPSSEFYAEYAANNHLFAGEPMRTMSPLTHNLLRGIDYEAVSRRRERNFATLHGLLGNVNELEPRIPVGPFMYPLLVRDGARVRTALQEKKIYVPTLWPYALQKDPIARDLAANILPLPIDQRYDEADMEYVAAEVLSLL